MTEFNCNVPDCLVLKIVEIDNDKGVPDTTLYIFYDSRKHRYIIRGRRTCSCETESPAYSFECKHTSDLYDFIDFVIDKDNTLSFILYNYDNLSSSSNYVTYDFLENYDDIDYEISGYDNAKFNKKIIMRNLRMLKHIRNEY